MALEPDKEIKGLWRDATVPAEGPAIHAIIVGITSYRHLPGGKGEQAKQTLGMTQLAVCASGAAQIFDWMRKAGRMAGRPFASCRLLLAPGDHADKKGKTETAYVNCLTDGWYEEPVYDAFEKAVKDWANELYRTPAAYKRNKAAFFFFSGHGLEVLANPCLLASDVLDPKSAQGHNNAIAYRSILTALPTYGVGDALFFLDSCRNQTDVARQLNIVGRDVLEPNPFGSDEPDCVAWLKATQAGMKAYSNPDSLRRASLFAQAILEALEGFGPTNEPYDCSGRPWRLLFENLESFTQKRIRALIKDAGSSRQQVVVPGGDPYNGETLIAERDQPAAPSPPLPPHYSKKKRPILSPDSRPSRVFQNDIEEAPKASTVRTGPDFNGNGKSLFDYGVMHQAFGSESVTLPWIQMLSLSTMSGAPLDADVIRLRGGSTSKAKGISWIDMDLAAGAEPIWLALDAAQWRGNPEVRPRSLAVLLPREEPGPIPIRVEYRFAENIDGVRPPIGLFAQIGRPTRSHAESWRLLWKAQRASEFSSLASALEMLPNIADELQNALYKKKSSPLAAAIACATLLQAGALDRLHDWPRNLANWFPTLPDGPVLWAETILRRLRRLRMGPEAGIPPADWLGDHEVRESFLLLMELAERGAPRLGPVLGMALRQLAMWDTNREAFAQLPNAERFDVVKENLNRAARYVETDTLFLSLHANTARLRPQEDYWYLTAVAGGESHANNASRPMTREKLERFRFDPAVFFTSEERLSLFSNARTKALWIAIKSKFAPDAFIMPRRRTATIYALAAASKEESGSLPSNFSRRLSGGEIACMAASGAEGQYYLRLTFDAPVPAGTAVVVLLYNDITVAKREVGVADHDGAVTAILDIQNDEDRELFLLLSDPSSEGEVFSTIE